MSTYHNDSVAQSDFENASNRANELAERISQCGRSGAPHAVMLELLKAWKLARHEARNCLERVHAQPRPVFGTISSRMRSTH